MILAAGEKDWVYQITYWFTALLPVILGFSITMLMIWYFTKHYKGPEDDENMEAYEKDEFVNDDN